MVLAEEKEEIPIRGAHTRVFELYSYGFCKGEAAELTGFICNFS